MARLRSYNLRRRPGQAMPGRPPGPPNFSRLAPTTGTHRQPPMTPPPAQAAQGAAKPPGHAPAPPVAQAPPRPAAPPPQAVQHETQPAATQAAAQQHAAAQAAAQQQAQQRAAAVRQQQAQALGNCGHPGQPACAR
jgi:hypothetical protein